MRSYGSNQNAIAASDSMSYSWLLTIVTTGSGTLYYSTKAYSYGGHSYTAKILANSISGGPKENRSGSEIGIIPKLEFEFSITNTDGGLSASDFDDATVLIEYVCDNGTYEEVMASWKMDVPEGYSKEVYDRIDVFSVGFLEKYIDGTWPNRPLVKDLYQTTDSDIVSYSKQDNLCVPIPIGTAYIPIRPVYIHSESQMRYYVLGLSSDTFTISAMRPPRDFGNYEYDNTYTYNQYTVGDYKVFQAIIADSDFDGTPDEPGIFRSGDIIYDALVQFTMDRTAYRNGSQTGTATATDGTGVTLTYSGDQLPASSVVGAYVVNRTTGAYGVITANSGVAKTITCSGGLSSGGWTSGNSYTVGGPASIIKFIWSDSTDGFGISTGDIDNSLMGSAEVTFAGWGLEWNHGFWYQQDREKLLSDLLVMCHSQIIVGEKIGIRVLSKTSQKTLTNLIKDSFRVRKLTASQNDSGRVGWVNAGDPADQLKTIIVDADSNTDYPSSDTLEFYLIENTIHAQNLAHLAFQRLYLRDSQQDFNTDFSCLALQAGDVITLNNADYGGNYTVLIESIQISKDGEITISTISFTASLDDWGDLSYGSVTVTDSSNDTTSTWSTVTAGPDEGNLNLLPGRLRLGTGDTNIFLDPTDPFIQLNVDSSSSEIIIGKLDTDIYGIQILNDSGIPAFQVDNTGSAYFAGDLTLGDGANYSGTITLNLPTEVSEDVYIAGLESGASIDANNWEIDDASGFLIGMDYTDGKAKMFFGKSGADYIKYDGTNLTLSAAFSASSIHIPDEDTTADSFHVDTDGNAWWGCTSSDFISDHDNATAYVLKTGETKFQNVAMGGTVVLPYTSDDSFTINYDNDDVDAALIIGRSTGGLMYLTWNGTLAQLNKPFKPTELLVNQISASEPGTTYAGQFWLDTS